MEIVGKIKHIGPDQQVSTSFTKRELVITTDETYPQHILTEFTQDKCDLLDHYKTGESVKVSINLRGREWVNPQGETRYFNSIQGWRIERLQVQGPASPSPEASTQNFNPATTSEEEEDPDDLPF